MVGSLLHLQRMFLHKWLTAWYLNSVVDSSTSSSRIPIHGLRHDLSNIAKGPLTRTLYIKKIKSLFDSIAWESILQRIFLISPPRFGPYLWFCNLCLSKVRRPIGDRCSYSSQPWGTPWTQCHFNNVVVCQLMLHPYKPKMTNFLINLIALGGTITVTFVMILVDIIMDCTMMPTITIEPNLVQTRIMSNIIFVVLFDIAFTCRQCFDISYQGSTTQPPAFVASVPMCPESKCYSNLGATNQIVADLNNP